MKCGFLYSPTDVPNTLVFLGWGGSSSDNSSHLPLCPYQTYAKGRIATHATERTQKTVDSVQQPQEHMLPLLLSLPRYSLSWGISELHYKWKINKYGGKWKWESFTSAEKTISCPTSPVTRALSSQRTDLITVILKWFPHTPEKATTSSKHDITLQHITMQTLAFSVTRNSIHDVENGLPLCCELIYQQQIKLIKLEPLNCSPSMENTTLHSSLTQNTKLTAPRLKND